MTETLCRKCYKLEVLFKVVHQLLSLRPQLHLHLQGPHLQLHLHQQLNSSVYNKSTVFIPSIRAAVTSVLRLILDIPNILHFILEIMDAMLPEAVLM